MRRTPALPCRDLRAAIAALRYPACGAPRPRPAGGALLRSTTATDAAWLRRAAAAPAACSSSTRETGKAVCARPPSAPRPLASNMKLFTTATALARFGPEARIATKVLADGEIDARRRPARQPLPAGRRRPGARHARLLRPLPRRPRHQPLRAQARRSRAAGIERGDRPALRRRHDLRPPARGRRLRLRDQPLHRPALGPRLQLRLRGVAAPAASPRTRRKVAASKLVALAARGRRPDPPAGRPRRRRPTATRAIASVASPPMTQHRQLDRRLLQQLLRRDADQAARRPLRRRAARPPPAPPSSSASPARKGSGVHAVDGSGLTRGNRASPAPGGRPAAGDAQHRRSATSSSSDLALAGHEGTVADRMRRHRRLRPLPGEDRHPDRGQQPLRLLLQRAAAGR